MKTKHILQRTFLVLLTTLAVACSDTGAIPDAPEASDHWAVTVSRNATGGGQVTVALRYGNTTSYGILQPAETEGENATWVGDKPTWPGASTSVQAIAISPAVTALPATVDATDGKAWLVDAVNCNAGSKPDKFTLTHLMAQMEVHIRLHDDAKHHYPPTDATIALHTTATIDYANKRLTGASGYQSAFSLGTFTKESGSTDTDENWVNTPQIVVPQTFVAGEPCLLFVVHGHTYTFVPSEDITLTAGQKTKLYLGAAYENAQVTLTKEGIVVADWSGQEINGGEATEE